MFGSDGKSPGREKNARATAHVRAMRMKIFKYPESFHPQQPPQYLKGFPYMRIKKILKRCGGRF